MRAADQLEPDPLWPEKILQLCQQLAGTSSAEDRSRVLGNLWLLANLALSRYVRYHANKGSVDPEDVKDIASEKALTFLQCAGDLLWTSRSTHPGQVCSYFSTLAHNGLMDHFRSRRRLTRTETGQEVVAEPSAHPENRVVRRQFADALYDCIGRLSAKTRLAWFLRVMLGMSSRDIAGHPKIRMNGTAVDMMLSRSRKVVRVCMQQKGFDPQDIPPGTLVLLWQSLRAELDDERSF